MTMKSEARQYMKLEHPSETQRSEARSLIALVLSYGKDELAEKLAMKYLDDLGAQPS